MRSRDGNKNSSLAIYALVFFYSLALNASEYLVSYRYVVKDMELFNESLQVSSAMKKCDGSLKRHIELPYKDKKNLREIIDNNSKEFIEYIHKLGLEVEHKSRVYDTQYTSTTIHTLKTTCFKVEFNDYFAKISPLK